MRFRLVFAIYRLLLPWFLAAAFPGWLLKMSRRGGFGSGLRERLAIYRDPADFEPCGTAHIHAVSVGEVMLASKLIRAWQAAEPGRCFVLAVGTSTGKAVAVSQALPGVRVVYAPLDLALCVKRYLDRFEPSQLVLVEGEIWPNLLAICRRRGIPVRLVNARMSPRSERRYRALAGVVRPVFALLETVAVQEEEDIGRWTSLGLEPRQVICTGSLKFDPGTAPESRKRPEFQEMLDCFPPDAPVVIAASTHPGEERLIAREIFAALPNVRLALVPRHAERRDEVLADLASEGIRGILRSRFQRPDALGKTCLVIDTTGELRDWTAHADVVIIGKSFLGIGGQNPAEAVLAGKPVAFGPHMENFEPLVSRLVAESGVWLISGAEDIGTTVRTILADPAESARRCALARDILNRHSGATARIIALLRGS